MSETKPDWKDSRIANLKRWIDLMEKSMSDHPLVIVRNKLKEMFCTQQWTKVKKAAMQPRSIGSESDFRRDPNFHFSLITHPNLPNGCKLKSFIIRKEVSGSGMNYRSIFTHPDNFQSIKTTPSYNDIDARVYFTLTKKNKKKAHLDASKDIAKAASFHSVKAAFEFIEEYGIQDCQVIATASELYERSFLPKPTVAPKPKKSKKSCSSN